MSRAKKSSRATPPPPKCPSCNAKLTNQAKFCHRCGTRADGQGSGATLSWKPLALVAVAIAAIFAVVAVVMEKSAPAPNATAASAPPSSTLPAGASSNTPSGAAAVDLSKLSPRQAADRLFNRVMAADERGDTAQAKRFAPMALRAYRLVKQLDDDARYHVGLINLVLGDAEQVRKQIDLLNKTAPDHLLGLYLAVNIAKQTSDKAAETQALARFNAAYDAEIATNRPEYQAHRATIEKLREQAQAATK